MIVQLVDKVLKWREGSDGPCDSFVKIIWKAQIIEPIFL